MDTVTVWEAHSQQYTTDLSVHITMSFIWFSIFAQIRH